MTESKTTPYHDDIFQAAEFNNLEAVQYFVEEAGIPPNITDSYKGGTAAHYSALLGNVDITKYLLEKDPSLLEMKDHYDDTIFFKAVSHGRLNLVKFFVEKYNVSISQRFEGKKAGNTPIHFAALSNRLEVLKYFIEERSGDVNIENDSKETPIFSAEENKHHTVIRYLIEEKNADPMKTDVKGRNILFKAIDVKDLDLFKYMLDKRKINLDVNHKDITGNTLLHRVVWMNRFPIMEYLINEKHADVNIVDESGETPLHKAARKNNFIMCKYLIEHGADAKIENNENKIPAQKASGEKLRKYFEMTSHSRNRRDASFMMSQLNPTLTTTENFNSLSMDRLEGNVPGAISRTNVSSFQLQSFLMVAEKIIGNAKGLSYQKSKPYSVLTRQEILREKMDSLPVDAVDAVSHFKDLHND